MECLYGLLFIAGLTCIYKFICYLFPDPEAPKIGREELLEAIGFQWKDSKQIYEELEKLYPKSPRISVGFLYTEAQRLKEEGYIETREVPRTNPLVAIHSPTKLEFRRTGKRLPESKKVRKSLLPESA